MVDHVLVSASGEDALVTVVARIVTRVYVVDAEWRVAESAG